MLLQNTILQQPSTPPIQKDQALQLLAIAMDVIGSVPVKALRMPECPDSF